MDYSYTVHTTTRHRTTTLWIEEYDTRYSHAARNYVLRKPRQINYFFKMSHLKAETMKTFNTGDTLVHPGANTA